MTNVALTVNGEPREANVEPRLLLVYFLREQLELKGTNVGCDTSSCGACTVLVDGESVKSCTVLTVQADGAEVTTIEGLATTASCTGAAGVPRAARTPVRLLHARFRDGDRLAPEGEPEPDGGGSGTRSRATCAAARVPQHRACGRGGFEGGRMIPAAFDYRRAASVEEAIDLLGDEDDEAARRRAFADPGAEAPHRASLGARRRRTAGRFALRARRRGPDRDRRADTARAACLRPGAPARLRGRGAGRGPRRRPAGAPSGRHRRLRRARRPASDLPTLLLALDADIVARGPTASGRSQRRPSSAASRPRSGNGRCSAESACRRSTARVSQARTPRAGLGDGRRRSSRCRRRDPGGARQHRPDAAPCPRRRGGPRKRSRGRRCGRPRRRGHEPPSDVERQRGVSARTLRGSTFGARSSRSS